MHKIRKTRILLVLCNLHNSVTGGCLFHVAVEMHLRAYFWQILIYFNQRILSGSEMLLYIETL